MPRFRVQKLRPNAKIPSRQHIDDAGLDLYSAQKVRLGAGERRLVMTGIALEIPQGYAGFVQPRSGMALRDGITVLNSPGLIDAGYRGEVGVILYNSTSDVDAKSKVGGNALYINEGDRIAQLVVISVPYFDPVEVEELSETKRGVGGFGSTG